MSYDAKRGITSEYNGYGSSFIQLNNSLFTLSNAHVLFHIIFYAIFLFHFSIYSSLSDRYGRRPFILLSLIGTTLEFWLVAWYPSITMLIIGAVIRGFTGNEKMNDLLYGINDMYQ